MEQPSYRTARHDCDVALGAVYMEAASKQGVEFFVSPGATPTAMMAWIHNIAKYFVDYPAGFFNPYQISGKEHLYALIEWSILWGKVATYCIGG